MKPFSPYALLSALRDRGFVVTLDGSGFIIDPAPPAELHESIVMLQTGIRACIAGRPWLGLSSDTGHAEAIDVHKLVPSWCSLLAVEGDSQWDRIYPRHDELIRIEKHPNRNRRSMAEAWK